MADKQISDLTSASGLTDGSLFVIEQGGAAKSANWGMMKNYISPGVAAQYSTSATYDVGDYVIYGGQLYRCKTAITTPESWTAAHWTATVLGDDIGELKNTAQYLTGSEPIAMTAKAFIDLSGSTVDINAPVSQDSFSYAVVSCTQGDEFIINATGLAQARCYAFIDASGNVLFKSTSYTVNNYIVAPYNVAYLVINDNSNSVSYKNSTPNQRITQNRNYIENIYEKAVLTTESGKYISLSGAVQSNADFQISNAFPIKQGRMFIKGNTNTASATYFINFYSDLPIGTNTFISGYNPTSPYSRRYIEYTEILVPIEAKYGVISTINTYPINNVTVAFVASASNKNSNDVFVNIIPSKTAVFLGDSITAGQGATGYIQWTAVVDGVTNLYRGNGPGYPDAGPDYQVGSLLLDIANYHWYESLSARGYANLFKDYIETKFSCTILNKGCSGISTSELISHYQEWVANCDIVFIMIGTNDRENTDYSTYKQRLYTITEALLNAGKTVYLLSSLPASATNESEASMRYHMEDVDIAVEEVAGNLGVKHISFYREVLKYCDYRNVSVDTLLADGLHPNDLGYKLLTRILLNELGVGLKLGTYPLS